MELGIKGINKFRHKFRRITPKHRLEAGKRAQMKIQQMSIMIVTLFFFFMLVGLFFVKIQLSGLQESSEYFAREQAISSIEIIANMPEFHCTSKESMCIDEDKIRVLSGNASKIYGDFWPVASIEVYKINTEFDEKIKCPLANCNYYNVFDNEGKSSQKYSTFVTLCKRVREGTYVYDKCEIAKLVVGAKIRDEN
ncbi:MAG: hypothetical protein IH845_01685 [Nanoarchaeota archaeon]|nr:hypothetical protein [Nanoarchaeota archaeon]